jgi:hypothetical protein
MPANKWALFDIPPPLLGTGRDPITLMVGIPHGGHEYVENRFPLPSFNRQGLEVGSIANMTTAWRCQICELDFEGPEFFRHQYGNRHLTEVQSQLQMENELQMMMFNQFQYQ